MAEIDSENNKVTLKKYFIYSKDKQGDKIGVCNLCKNKNIEKTIKMKQGNTSGLKSHLHIYHIQEYNLLYGSFSRKKSISNQTSLEVFVSFSVSIINN